MREELPDVDEEVKGAIRILAQHVNNEENNTSLANYIDEVEEPDNSHDLYNYLLRHPKPALSLVNELEDYFDHPAPLVFYSFNEKPRTTTHPLSIYFIQPRTTKNNIYRSVQQCGAFTLCCP